MVRTVEQQLADYPPPRERLLRAILRIHDSEVAIDYTLTEREDALTVTEWLEIGDEFIPAVIIHFGTWYTLHSMALAIKEGSGFPVEFTFYGTTIEGIGVTLEF